MSDAAIPLAAMSYVHLDNLQDVQLKTKQFILASQLDQYTSSWGVYIFNIHGWCNFTHLVSQSLLSWNCEYL